VSLGVSWCLVDTSVLEGGVPKWQGASCGMQGVGHPGGKLDSFLISEYPTVSGTYPTVREMNPTISNTYPTLSDTCPTLGEVYPRLVIPIPRLVK